MLSKVSVDKNLSENTISNINLLQKNKFGVECRNGTHLKGGECVGNDVDCKILNATTLNCNKCAWTHWSVNNSDQGNYCDNWPWWIW